MNKKLSRTALVTFTVLSLVFSISPSQAATKQGSACTKSGSKSGIYTCTTNALTTSKKLVWLSADCVAAIKAFQTTKKDADAFVAQQKTALSKVQLSIDSWNNVLNLNNTRKAALATNLYIVDYTHSGGKATPVKVQGMANAITEIGKKITELTGFRDATAKLADGQKAGLSPKYTTEQIAAFTTNFKSYTTNADVNVKNYVTSLITLGNWNSAINNWQRNIDNINKVAAKIDTDIAKAQAQIESLTKQLTRSQASQKEIGDSLGTTVVDAKSVATVACRTGK